MNLRRKSSFRSWIVSICGTSDILEDELRKGHHVILTLLAQCTRYSQLSCPRLSQLALWTLQPWRLRPGPKFQGGVPASHPSAAAAPQRHYPCRVGTLGSVGTTRARMEHGTCVRRVTQPPPHLPHSLPDRWRNCTSSCRGLASTCALMTPSLVCPICSGLGA